MKTFWKCWALSGRLLIGWSAQPCQGGFLLADLLSSVRAASYWLICSALSGRLLIGWCAQLCQGGFLLADVLSFVRVASYWLMCSALSGWLLIGHRGEFFCLSKLNLKTLFEVTFSDQWFCWHELISIWFVVIWNDGVTTSLEWCIFKIRVHFESFFAKQKWLNYFTRFSFQEFFNVWNWKKYNNLL